MVKSHKIVNLISWIFVIILIVYMALLSLRDPNILATLGEVTILVVLVIITGTLFLIGYILRILNFRKLKRN